MCIIVEGGGRGLRKIWSRRFARPGGNSGACLLVPSLLGHSENMVRRRTCIRAEGHLPVVRYLLRHGVNPNVRDSTNDTPLLLASWKGHRDVAQCLLKHGADVDLLDNDHNAPLACAAFYEHANVVQLVLEHNAEANSQEKNGHTPLHNAIRSVILPRKCISKMTRNFYYLVQPCTTLYQLVQGGKIWKLASWQAMFFFQKVPQKMVTDQ